MDPLELRSVGSTSVAVSQLGLGGAGLGGLYRPVADAQADEAYDYAFRSGVRYFDTAPEYGHGRSEKHLGRALKIYSDLPRTVSTKVGRVLLPPSPSGLKPSVFADPIALEPTFDFSRSGVLKSLESSLERLGVDYVDIAYIHDPDGDDGSGSRADYFAEVMDEAYPTLLEEKANGSIRAIGVGMNQWPMLLRFAEAADFDCFLLAGRYTLLEHEPLVEFLPACEERGISVIIGGPFNSGILATGVVAGATYDYGAAGQDVTARVTRIEALCQAHGIPLAAAALQFPFGHPAVVSVIPGARSRAEVERNLQAVRCEIPGSFWEQMKAESLLPAGAVTPSTESD